MKAGFKAYRFAVTFLEIILSLFYCNAFLLEMICLSIISDRKNRVKNDREYQVKTILFIRHAKVDMDSSEAIYAKSLKEWESRYNDAPIVDGLPDMALIAHIKDADYVLSSTLRRSIDSLRLLDVEIDEKSRLFNEAEIPVLEGRMIKLKPVYWLLLFRIFSLCGIGRWARTLKQTKEDAKLAAKRLEELSTEHEKIVMMGHGVMNWLIRKELRQNGWSIEDKEMHTNWGCTVLFNQKAG